MPDFKESSKKIIENHIKVLSNNGFKISQSKLDQYNYNVDVSDLKDKVKLLVYFSSKGNKITLQGNKELLLYKKVHDLVFGEQYFTNENKNLTEPDTYIGTDESGKGDYFGPLVVAAVLVDTNISKKLREFDVRDSKELNDYSISVIAEKIKNLDGCVFKTIAINPEKYNTLYEQMGNLNQLLGWAHAKAIENVLSIKSVPEAISDKFGNEKYIQGSLQKLGKQLLLRQETKAEKYTAVAAASILARDEFNKWFFTIKKKQNLDLPKGASSIVENKAREIKNKYGIEVLRTLAKLHFKTTKKLY